MENERYKKIAESHEEIQQLISDKDLHCVARLLQGEIFAESLFYGCSYCKYKSDCFYDGKLDLHVDELRKKLQLITGVDLSPCFDSDNLESKFRGYQ